MSISSDSIAKHEPPQPEKRSWTSYIWDTWDKSPEERRFLTRLDACLLTYASLSYFSKNLDQANITNAYVSGMQEELGLKGNELNYITTAWTCGYVIGQIPSNLIITRIRPSIWIPTMEVIWSVLTMVLASSKGFNSIIAIRFFIGLAESTFYPAMQYVIGSWYKPDELAKRACMFHAAGAIGQMFSGFLQAGAYNGLNGARGMAGWRWLFIIDGIITVPIGLLGYLLMPDTPALARPSILYSEEQLAMARARMEAVGRKSEPTKFTREKVKGFFSTWHIYCLVPLYVLFNNSFGPGTAMIFWLKYLGKYTVEEVNLYPIGQKAYAVVMTLVMAWWSDAIQKRWPPIVAGGISSIICCSVLAATSLDTHIARRWAFYYLTDGHGGLSGLILSWANELTGHDNEKRAFTVASCNMFAYVFQAWLPILIFPQTQQPRVKRGNLVTIGISAGIVFFALLTLTLQTRDQRRAARRVDGDSKTGRDLESEEHGERRRSESISKVADGEEESVVVPVR